MRTKTIIGAVSLGLVIAALGVAVKEWMAAARLTATLETANAKRREFDSEIHRGRQQIAAAEKNRADLEHELNGLRLKASVTSTPSATSRVPATPPSESVRAAMLNDPKFQNLQLAARRASLSAAYDPLLAQLGLSTDQIRKFKDRLVAYDEKKLDADAVRETQGLAVDDPAIVRFNEQNARELQTVQQELLGEAGYRQLQDYERSLPARKAVDNFAGTAAITGVPLSPDQAERLTTALANTSATFRAGERVQDPDWETALVPAANFLSEAQLALIRRTLVPDRYLQRIQDLAARPSAPTSTSQPPSR